LHVVFDAVAVRPGSAAVVVGRLIQGWTELDTGDRLTVVCDGPPPFELPANVGVHRLTGPGLWNRSLGIRAAARRLGAEALVSGVPASALAGAPCRRGTIVYDLRHELRPDQFGRRTRIARRLSWGLTFATSGGLYCISARTRDDLVASRPRLAAKAHVALLGADHADAWGETGERTDEQPYALAFGHFANKNVDAVLDAWTVHCRESDELELRLVGMGAADREEAARRVAELGVADRVSLQPWLDDEGFAAQFAGAAVVLFPSDFEGFGLPAVEALRLGIPVVVSGDPALAEVTGGHAVVAEDLAPGPLARAIGEALATPPEDRAAGRTWAGAFTWARMAQTIRDDLTAR